MQTRLPWRRVSLDSIADFRNGINYNKSNFGRGIRVVGVKDFQDRSFPDFSDLEEIDPAGVVRDEHVLKEGDVLFVRSNGNRELIGRSMFVRNLPDARVTHSAFTIRVRMRSPEANPRFFAYLFKSRLIRDVLSAQGNGANISNLNQDILSRLQVPVPSLGEQARIASILSAYDDLIENNMRRIAILEEMARRIYEEWFVRFRFPGHENVRMVESELGLVPEGWDLTTLGSVCAYINRGLAPKYDDDAPGTVINQKCIRDQRLSLSEARRQSKSVPTEKLVVLGDVLINSTGVGTLGRVAQVLEPVEACTVDTHVSIVRPSSDVDHDFFGLALLSKQPHFEAQGVGSTGQTELSRSRISETRILLPAKRLQDQFGRLVRPMRQLAVRLQAKNGNLRTTRDLLLPKLISGELDVSAMPEPETAAI
jgi:type I restriction enzyme, S subunit